MTTKSNVLNGSEHKQGHFKFKRGGKGALAKNGYGGKIKFTSSDQPVQTNPQEKRKGNKRSEKRAMLKAQKKGQHPIESSTCLLLRNLPPSVNYNMLKNTVPKATRLQIFKKGSKRHAFANFETHKACRHALKHLNGSTLDGHQLQAKFVTRQPRTEESRKSEGAPPSLDKSITLSNLPFTITKAELEEEFPTASDIILNMNKNGRFRGSCLLCFETADDCKVVWDACRGRKVGGRLVFCRAGACFQADPKPKQIWGVKLRGLPADVTNTQLAALFDKETLIKAHCELNSDGSSKTGLLRFSTADAQRAALRMLNEQEFFGVRIRCRPWVPQKVRSKRLPEDSPTTETTETPRKQKEVKELEVHTVTDEFNSEKITLERSMISANKKRRHSVSELDANAEVATPATSAKKKRRQSES